MGGYSENKYFKFLNMIASSYTIIRHFFVNAFKTFSVHTALLQFVSVAARTDENDKAHFVLQVHCKSEILTSSFLRIITSNYYFVLIQQYKCYIHIFQSRDMRAHKEMFTSQINKYICTQGMLCIVYVSVYINRAMKREG